MQRYGSLDYPTLAKRGFLFGLSLFVVGGIGALIGHSYFEPVPGWLDTILFDAEVIGLLLALFSPIVFGIVMPLTE